MIALLSKVCALTLTDAFYELRPSLVPWRYLQTGSEARSLVSVVISKADTHSLPHLVSEGSLAFQEWISSEKRVL